MPVPNAHLVRRPEHARSRPFTDVRLRQAVAWALPYDQIMQASLFGRGVPMSGGPDNAGRPNWP